jgi:hypothetical protein
LSQDDKNDNEGNNESNSSDQESKIVNIERNEDTDPVNEYQEETSDSRRAVRRSGQVVKPVVRTNVMHFNSPTLKDSHYENEDGEGRVMAHIITKFNSLNLVRSQQYTMQQTYILKQGLH